MSGEVLTCVLWNMWQSAAVSGIMSRCKHRKVQSGTPVNVSPTRTEWEPDSIQHATVISFVFHLSVLKCQSNSTLWFKKTDSCYIFKYLQHPQFWYR